MPRSSRHKSSHKSHRRSSPVDWSGSDEERESEPRVSRDSESEKRKSSHSKELKESTNGYASVDHGKKRKERADSKDESAASDRWDSGLGRDGDDDALVEKRSKGDVYSTVDTEKEKEKEKEKYLKEESKSRSSRRHDGSSYERSEEKRRYKEEREREKEREKEKERGREKEKEKEQEREKESDRDRDRDRDREREREREREKNRDRDRERSSRREKYEEDKREKERYEGERREKERYEEDKREKDRYEEIKRDKERYEEDKREKERHEDAVASRKRESDTSRIEEGSSVKKDVTIITETDATEREQREKHSKRRRDEVSLEEKDKDREKDKEREREREREREKEKERHRDDHSKSRSSKEQKAEPDKYKEKHRDRDRDDHREREYYEYKNSREGNRSSETRYKKSKGSEADLYDNRDDYPSKHKDSHGSKKGYEASEDRHERDMEKEDVDRLRGEYRYMDKEKDKEKEKTDSSPGKIRVKGSPGSSSYHGRDQSRHRSKTMESPKKEPLQEEKPRGRTSSSTGERTPSRLRDDKLNRPRDDAHSLELSSDMASSTPRSDTRASPKFAPEKSPSNTSHKYSSSRGGSGSSKYRDRDRERDRERESDMPTPDKPILKREPTPIGTSNRSNSSSSFPPLPYEDGDNRRESGPDRRFHKRGGHAHGNNNNWNGALNWASQVNNGFMPLPPGPPPPSGFHHFATPPPPLFGIRPPPLKLGPSGVGVSFPVHDPMDRFSGHMRGPYGWHNNSGNNPLVEEPFTPNLWGPAGSGVFGADPFWDQNRPLTAWKAHGEMPNKDLISVSQKEIGAPPPPVKMEEQSVIESLPSESVDVKNESVKVKISVEASGEDQMPQKVVAEVDKRQEASVKATNFWESYIPKIGISHDLVDLDLYEKCTSVLGELEQNIGVSNMPQADPMGVKEQKNGMGVIVLKSFFPINKGDIFQKAISLYNKLADRQKPEGYNSSLGTLILEKSEVSKLAAVSNVEVEVPATDNISVVGVTPELGNEMEVESKASSNFVSDSDSIIFKNVAEECEAVMKESSEDGLSRIPISTENTH